MYGLCFLVSLKSRSNSVSLMGSVQGLLPFSGVILNSLRSVSKSSHFNMQSSPMRIAVSLSVRSAVPVVLPHPDIRRSISSSVGIK